MANYDPQLTFTLDSLNQSRKHAIFVSVGLVIALLFFISLMIVYVSKHKPEVRLVAFDHRTMSFQVVDKNIPQDQLYHYVRSMLYNYVEGRHSIDKITEQRGRYERIARMSNHEVAAEFNQELLDAQNYYQGEKRNVEVLSDISIINNHTQGIHQIDFKTVDYKEDQSVERHWVAKIEYIVSPESLTKETVLENPLGVFVTAYTKSPKKHYQESTNANNHR